MRRAGAVRLAAAARGRGRAPDLISRGTDAGPGRLGATASAAPPAPCAVPTAHASARMRGRMIITVARPPVPTLVSNTQGRVSGALDPLPRGPTGHGCAGARRRLKALLGPLQRSPGSSHVCDCRVAAPPPPRDPALPRRLQRPKIVEWSFSADFAEKKTEHGRLKTCLLKPKLRRSTNFWPNSWPFLEKMGSCCRIVTCCYFCSGHPAGLFTVGKRFPEKVAGKKKCFRGKKRP